MNNRGYIENLQVLDFQTENQVDSSVFFVNKLEQYIQGKVSPYIIIALDKAKLFEADAVYFRFFDDNRPPLAQLYIYDNITKDKPADYYAKKHKEIWSSCEIASFLVIDKTIVKIFDSRKPVKIESDKIHSKPIKEINLLEINNIAKEYKAHSFDNGSFWENKEMKNHFLNSKIASERLVKGFKSIRNHLRKNINLSKELIDQLLIVCILIKYLEETGFDKGTNTNLAHKFFVDKTGYEKLEDIIYNDKLVCLLSELAYHFNGGIFSIDDKFIQEINQNNTEIRKLARFFEAEYKTNLFGWKEYSFEHIPVELISNFYEEFIPKTANKEEKTEEKSKESTGAVYTPSFLVNLLIDECLPLSDLNENVKLLDPACGSGIFLVSAYKRLVQRWRLKNKNGNELAQTTPDILKKILIKNIFGIDVNSKSVNLSIFSLQLALCSMLTPKQIWTECTFDDLQEEKNIVKKDFFKHLIDKSVKHDFNLIIGNPPFKRKILDNNSYEYYETLLEENNYPIKFKNPQKEFAYLFLEKAMHFLLEKEGKLCLILPSGQLLYSDDSVGIRKSLFSTYNVSQIIDFTFLRRILFQATVATLSIFIDKKPPTKEPVLHITAKRTKQSKERYYFEFDHYDFYKVPKELVVDKINVWKCNLLGGLRICDIVDKFNNIKPKLKDFWHSNDIHPYNKVKKKDLFPTSKKEEVMNNTLFSEEIFIPVKSNDYWGIRKKITKGVFPTEIIDNDFKNKNGQDKNEIDAIGFKGSIENIEQLKKYIEKYSEWICFFVSAISGRQGIRSPYVMYLSDLEKFPYIENLKDYVSETDRIIIEDIAKYTLEEFGNGEDAQINISEADDTTLKEFAQVYSDMLNVFYYSENKRYTLTSIREGDAYFICDIEYTDENISQISINPTDDKIDDLLFDDNNSQSKKINKVIRSYRNGGNIIRIIKPKQLRFWLKSKALKDADETFDDILKH
jgi:hypothetical protein